MSEYKLCDACEILYGETEGFNPQVPWTHCHHDEQTDKPKTRRIEGWAKQYMYSDKSVLDFAFMSYKVGDEWKKATLEIEEE